VSTTLAATTARVSTAHRSRHCSTM
jgi:hypothetical protein